MRNLYILNLSKLVSIIAAVGLSLLTSGAADAAWPYALDGSFGEWSGALNISDASGDGKTGADIRYFYWGTNANDSTIYLMLERYADSETSDGDQVTYRIYVDANNDGQYNSGTDRVVRIDYKPKQNSSDVDITISKPNGSTVAQYSGKWGESKRDGALKVEAKAPFADLGISANQTIRMYAVADNGDRAPNSGDVQWSPIPILDYPLLAATIIAIAGFAWWKRGRFAWRTS